MGQAQLSYTLHVPTECSKIGHFTHMLNEWENPTWEFEGKFHEVRVASFMKLFYGKFVLFNYLWANITTFLDYEKIGRVHISYGTRTS